MAVERCEVMPQLAQVKATINPPQQVIRRNVIVELEGVEQRLLPARSLSHHRRRSLSNASLSA
jgi:hypothetical protein